MAKVYIGVGHGGTDPGAVAGGYKEKDINLTTAMACYGYLKDNGVDAIISRTADRDVTISTKVKASNDFGAEYCLDIHYNAGGGDGSEVYVSKSGRGNVLAGNILDELRIIGQNSRGVKLKTTSDGRDYFGFIRDTKAPAALVECAFLDNPKDMEIANTAEKQRIIGIAIAEGVLKTLGITEGTSPPQEAAPAKSTEDIADEVIAGKWGNGDDRKQRLTDAGHDYSTVQAAVNAKLDVKPAASIKVGSTVRVNQGAKTYIGGGLASFVYGRDHKVTELVGNRAVISYGNTVVAAVRVEDLMLQG